MKTVPLPAKIKINNYVKILGCDPYEKIKKNYMNSGIEKKRFILCTEFTM